MILGSLLLLLHVSQQHSSHATKYLSFWKCFFMSGSSLTDTGFSIASIKEQFSTFGLIVLLILIEIGGIGIISIKVLFFITVFKKLNYDDKIFMQEEKGTDRKDSTFSMIKINIFSIMLIQFFGMIIFATYLYFGHFRYNHETILKYGYGEDLWKSFFISVSATNNCGLELFSNFSLDSNHLYSSNSLSCFRSSDFALIFIPILIILGGIGFPVYYEVYLKLKNVMQGKHKISKNKHQTLLIIKSYFLILFAGFIILCIVVFTTTNKAKNRDWNNLSTWHKIINVWFINISARNAGFSTFNLKYMSSSFKLCVAILMWIGASPFSTGGGVRSTTIYIIIVAVYAYIKGKKQTIVNKNQSLDENSIKKSFLVILISILLIFVIFWLFVTINHKNSLFSDNSNINGLHFTTIDLFFDLCSAFGTSGLSTGTVSYVQNGWLVVFVVLMIIGQLTISNVLLIWKSKKNNKINLLKVKTFNALVG